VPWAGVVYNGLNLADAPFGEHRTDALCFVGRVVPEKGIVEAIEVAKASGRPLKIAAKVAAGGIEREYFDEVFQPALRAAGSSIEYIGEISQEERDQLFAESYAALMPGSWPEPFGLVAIESMATGTPVIGRRAGGLTETIDHGVTGYLVDDVDEAMLAVNRVGALARKRIAAMTRERFSAERMIDAYEAVYRDLVTPHVVRDEESSPGDTVRRPRPAEELVATAG
jgi:glycosyltransferase involved in cell wall biosynthesis